MSYDRCFHVTGTTIKMAKPSGSQETMNITIGLVGIQLYLGIVTYDEAENGGQMSNIPAVFIQGPPPTTTTGN